MKEIYLLLCGMHLRCLLWTWIAKNFWDYHAVASILFLLWLKCLVMFWDANIFFFLLTYFYLCINILELVYFPVFGSMHFEIYLFSSESWHVTPQTPKGLKHEKDISSTCRFFFFLSFLTIQSTKLYQILISRIIIIIPLNILSE